MSSAVADSTQTSSLLSYITLQTLTAEFLSRFCAKAPDRIRLYYRFLLNPYCLNLYCPKSPKYNPFLQAAGKESMIPISLCLCLIHI
jgi:hypothetical protein